MYLACAAWVWRYNEWCVCSIDAVWYWAGCRCQLWDTLLQDYGLDCNPLLSYNNIRRGLATCRHIPEGPDASESGRQEALNQLPAPLNPALQRSYNQYLNKPDNKVLSPWHHQKHVATIWFGLKHFHDLFFISACVYIKFFFLSPYFQPVTLMFCNCWRCLRTWKGCPWKLASAPAGQEWRRRTWPTR